MGQIETRLDELGLVLPAPLKLPPGVKLSFPWVRVYGNRAY
ncbi:MAG TPA: RidA family protein, partial [Gammaproteobacteria bacterium]|nr:RidA family protein [Gammaproteobacteria bacterium]